MYFVFLWNAPQHVQEESPSRAAENYAAVTYTHLETGSRGGSPFEHDVKKFGLHLKYLPWVADAQGCQKARQCVSSGLFSVFWFFILSENFGWFAQFLVFFS